VVTPWSNKTHDSSEDMSQDGGKSASSGPTAEDAILNAELEPPEPRAERCGAPDYRPQPRRPEPRLKTMIQRRILPRVRTNRFKYSPIADDEIRLLGIRAGKPEDDVFCVIFKRKLAHVKQKYEALSYSWGNARADCEIHIQDLNVQLPNQTKKLSFVDAAQLKGPRRFFVRPNLYAAITHLRKEKKDVTFWIDAICIDQTPEGKEEKQKQLAKMAEIYNSAFNVCIWLGEADIQGHSDSAMQLIRKITNFHTFDVLVASEEAKSQWHDLIELMKSSWFSRRWVVQEVVLARRASVHCGTKVIHWDDLCDAVSLFNDKLERLRDHFGDHDIFGDVESLSASILVKSLHEVCRKSDDGTIQEHLMGLETLVSTLLTFENSNYHDTIFSLMSIAKDTPKSFLPGVVKSGLSSEMPPFQITADYKRSVRDLYSEFIEFCVQTSDCLDIICRHWAPPVVDVFDMPINMPTWISSLSKSPFGLPQETQGRQNGENFVRCFGRDARKRYNASRGTEPKGFHFRKNSFGPPSRSRAVSGAAKAKDDITSPLQVILEDSPTNGDLPSPITAGRSDHRAPVSERLTSRSLGRLITSNLHPTGTDTASPAPTSASSAASTKEKEDLYSGILRVAGFRLGSVVDHSDVIRRGVVPGDWLAHAGWRKDESQNRVPDRLWRTLVADRSPDGSSPPGWYQRACLHCLVDTRITDGHGNLNASSYASRKTAEMTMQFMKRVESVVWNRRFFKGGDEGELFGLAPEGTEKGDLVCILFGCTVPVVLREVDTIGGVPLCEIVGEAYVHGKMDGEAVVDVALVDSLKQWFDLK